MSISKAQELRNRIAKLKEEVTALQEYWASLYPEFPDLPVRTAQVWLKLYTFDQVVGAIETTNMKFSRRLTGATGPMDFDQAVRYASGVMKGLKEGRVFDHTGEMSTEVK